MAGLKESGLDLPQIKKQLAALGYLDTSEASEPSGVEDSGQSDAPPSGSVNPPAPKTGEAFVMELLSKVDKANEKMEKLREEQFAKDRRLLKYQKRRERLLAQMEHMGFWRLLFKRKGIVAELRKVDEAEGERLRPIHIQDKEGLERAMAEPNSWVGGVG